MDQRSTDLCVQTLAKIAPALLRTRVVSSPFDHSVWRHCPFVTQATVLSCIYTRAKMLEAPSTASTRRAYVMNMHSADFSALDHAASRHNTTALEKTRGNSNKKVHERSAIHTSHSTRIRITTPKLDPDERQHALDDAQKHTIR